MTPPATAATVTVRPLLPVGTSEVAAVHSTLCEPAGAVSPAPGSSVSERYPRSALSRSSGRWASQLKYARAKDSAKVRAWRSALEARPSICAAVRADYGDRLREFLKAQGGVMAELMR